MKGGKWEKIYEAPTVPGTGIGVNGLDNLKISYPKIYSKISKWSKEEQTRFMESFKTEKTLKALDESPELVDVWRNVYTSDKIDILQVAKRLKDKNLIFNGKFDPIDNPGCFGHLDEDVELLLLNSGWKQVKVPMGTSKEHFYFEKLTGRVFNGKRGKILFRL